MITQSEVDKIITINLIGGSQAPELELQHEMNHFPSFPISKSTTRVPRGDYSTRRIPTGQNYQSVSSTTASSLNQHQMSYTPTMTNILENLGVSGSSGTERMATEGPPIIMTL